MYVRAKENPAGNLRDIEAVEKKAILLLGEEMLPADQKRES